MTTDTKAGRGKPDGKFHIEGSLQLQAFDSAEGDLPLKVAAFDKLGEILGEADVDAKGQFSLSVSLAQAADVQVLAGPAEDAKSLRQSSAFSQSFSAKQWERQEGRFILRPQLIIPPLIWRPWWPVRICVSGHVRKIHAHNGVTETCPVPFVKVEIFDVDREGCWWPPIRRWWDTLVDRPVIRVPDLLKNRPFPPIPLPGPDPAPELRLEASLTSMVSRGAAVSLNPQPLPPKEIARSISTIGNLSAFNPQPELQQTAPANLSVTRVGEARLMDNALATALERLTLTSKVPPWLIFPRCFFSKRIVCETFTDCDGFFKCCFRWYPFHFRNGRLRFDARPDIIVRITQIINGVPTVIYMDPYTSTRWNVTNAHIDLFLDNEEVRCGHGCHSVPEGSPVFFTRVGNDEVYQINQGTGLYADATYSSMAYGGGLDLFGVFGDALATGAPKRYYRLSYKKRGAPDTDFKFIDSTLSDTKVDKATLTSSDQSLGPQTVGTTTTLYEVRNRNDFYWYNPDRIGSWWTPPVEEDTAVYVLRLEMFDELGNYLSTASGQVDYRDGTVTPPAVLPPMVDHCDLIITLDNKPAVVNLTIPAVLNDCGVIPWSPTLTLDFNVGATQENNRLHSWALQYTKGVNPAITVLASDASAAGTLNPVNTVVSGAPLLVGLASTCAFALKLYAYAHIRNGYGFVYYTEQIKAIAIEKCAPCPDCGPVIA